MKISLNDHEIISGLTELIGDLANVSLEGPREFMRFWIQSTPMPPEWQARAINSLRGNGRPDALNIIRWAINQKTNPADPRYATLGSLLTQLIEDDASGLENRKYMLSVILARDLYNEPKLRQQLVEKYGLPMTLAGEAADAAADYGPEIDWKGPSDSVELQSLWKPDPEFIDVGVLMGVLERAAGVCRIEFDHTADRGTGFYLGNKLVLTNHHVMGENDEEIGKNAARANLLFGKVTDLGAGGEVAGKSFRLAAEPVVAVSEALDYALLRVEDSIAYSEAIKAVPLDDSLPEKSDQIHILGHPSGEAMKLAMSGEGVVHVSELTGLVQYTTRAVAGASGSPCFSEDWNAVVLHHAQRSRGFGVVREGILIRSILAEISGHL